MPVQDELRFATPAMRIFENEHRYLSYLMEEWHAIVLTFEETEHTSLEECRRRLQELRRMILEFMEPLKKHTLKEEAHFFPMLGTYIGYEQGPLVGIQEEHSEIDGYLGHFLHRTSGYTDLMSKQEITSAVKDAGEAFEVLTVHFVKEETVIYPMAESQLNALDKDRLHHKLNTLIT
ncbi:hemerythrin domain-containing protein [Paenibacillus sp. sgz500958]|uniref:hemerythrin domain-containing protein n=1 Tax=Paenibacillus sp. sgz500958 TaxID=3242475 RepID=UPI0036D3A06D